MAVTVYILCAVTSLMCAILLGRGYCHSKNKLLAWSSAGFSAFALANITLCLDLIVFPNFDLVLYRTLLNLVAVLLLLVGLIWDTHK